MKFAVIKGATMILGAALMAGCASFGVRDHKGAVLDSELISAVQVGTDNKDSVAQTLGRPTFTGTFDPNDWYYVSRDTGSFAFRNPKVLDQTVLHVRSDQAGNVALVEKTGKELVVNIDPSGDRTPTLGRKRGFFEEMFGNIGTVGSGLPGGGQNPGQ